MIGTAAATGWYVYAVVEAGGDPGRAIEGLGPGFSLLTEGDLAAVVGSVPLDEFGADVLPERLNDRAWLEEHARQHEDVLQRLAETTAVVPLRFGAIYLEREDVAELLRRDGASFRAAIERVRGRVELGVKGWVDRRRSGRPDSTAAPGASTGRAYLERRRKERRLGAEATAELAQAVADAHARLLALAVDGVANRPQPRELTGRDEEMVLNGAYLVPAGDDTLVREASRLEARYASLGLGFEVTGPWPAHNFVDQETA